MAEHRQTWVVSHQVVAKRTLDEASDHLESLSTRECLELLGRGGLGRVAFTVGELAIVLPVNYALLDEREIVFLTSSGSKLRAVENGQVLTFEIDHLGVDGIGWSVLATGPCRTSDDPVAVLAARGRGVNPHAPGLKDHVVSIEVRYVTGRRFGSPATATRPLHHREP